MYSSVLKRICLLSKICMLFSEIVPLRGGGYHTCVCSLNCAVVVDNNKVEIFGATTESQLMQICHREIL